MAEAMRSRGKSAESKPGARVRYRDMPVPMRVLRLMLGATFLYAGIYKAMDGTFLDPASRGYIGAQLQGFVQSSPIAFLLNRMIEHATLIGWSTMLGEIAIGLATLIGVWMWPAAIFGAILSLMLWLSSSWSVSPYFLASDPAYLAMWIAFLVGVWPKGDIIDEVASMLIERRRLMQAAAVGGLSIAMTAVVRPFASSATATPSGSESAPASTAGKKVATLDEVPVGKAMTFTASDGSPAIVVRTGTDSVAAYSAVCTHQGCVVDYLPAYKQMVCPCHGASFDPAKHAEVTAGPTSQPLQEYKATISGNDIIVA